MIRKLIYFIAWVGIFILSLLGLAWSVSAAITMRFIGRFFTVTPACVRILVFALSVLYFFLVLFRIRFKSGKEDNYEIRTTDGVVTVSPQIITDYVRESLKQDEDIKNLKVETFRSDKKFNIKIKTELATEGNVAEKSIHIQNKIKREIADKIGINIGDVEVKISKFINKSFKDAAVASLPEKTPAEKPAPVLVTPEPAPVKPEPAATYNPEPIITPIPEPVISQPSAPAEPAESVSESEADVEARMETGEAVEEEPKKEKRTFFGLFRKKPKEIKEEEKEPETENKEEEVPATEPTEEREPDGE